MANQSTYNGVLLTSKAPNLPIAPVEYSQQYQDQLINALRLYFNQIDNFTQGANKPDSGPTANRPVDNLFIGQPYFDTTINTLVIWTGSAWVSAVPASASPVTSFSAGTTGLTPNTATTGAVTLAGTLGYVNGGTGLSTLGAAGSVLSSTGSAVAWSPPVPIGTIHMWATGTAPSGYLLCDGTSVSTTTYAALFAVIGYTFGGSGASFSLPNYTNRMPYGTTIGATGGSADAVVVSHTHGITDLGHAHDHTLTRNNCAGGSGGADGWGVNGGSSGTANLPTSSATTGISVNTAGVSGTNANLPPYLGINFIIKT